jgi:hypothetical protein
MCRASVTRQQDDFNAALEALLPEHASSHDARAQAMSAEDGCSVTERYVSVESRALLSLAERIRLAVQFDSAFLPSLARVP